MSRKTKPKGATTTRVYVEDRGAIYDAPIDVVWDFFLRDQTYHPRAHGGTVRRFRETRLSEVTTLLRYEAREGGRWVKRACRMTTVPPAVRVQEDLRGPEAGSIKVYLYSPKGAKTRVDVLAYMRRDERSPKRLRADTRRGFADAYREDLPWFTKYVRSLGGKREVRSGSGAS